MAKYNSDVNQIKRSVLIEVSKMAFEDSGEDYAQNIPYKIIPGMQPRYRCCVYKEREILRQRIKLARNLTPAGYDEKRLLNVIKEACHNCPINRFQVTPNCQKCLAKGCIANCRFGAISMTPQGAYIDQTKCKECGKCVDACPYHAISDTQRPCVKSCPVNAIDYDNDKLAVIKKGKCVLCGNCIQGCPFGAISDAADITKIIGFFKSPSKTYAIVAPSIEGQFGICNLATISEGIKALGFDGVYEVSIGADAVSLEESKEVVHNLKENKKTLTSCCPSFYSMIEKHFPALVPYISSTVSPMIATSRLVREKHKGEDIKIVFIGPCVAKKQEAAKDIPGNVDSCLTFEELDAMFAAKGIKLEFSKLFESDATVYGRNFALTGGVAAAVEQAIEQIGSELKASLYTANGAKECYRALQILKAGKFSSDVLEGMGCIGGCIGGSATLVTQEECKANREKMLNNENTDIRKSVEKNGLDKIKLLSAESR